MANRSLIVILLVLSSNSVYCQIELLTEPLKYHDHPDADVFIGEKLIDLIPGAGMPASEVPFDQDFYFKAIVPCGTCQVESVGLKDLQADEDISIGIITPAKSKPENSYNDLVYIGISWLDPASYYSLSIVWEEKDTVTSSSVSRQETYSFSTIPKTFFGRNKQRLSAEFGVMGAGFRNDNRLQPEFALCFAVNYHLRPVNKDVPLRNYGLLHMRRFTAVMGVTINSMAKPRLRSDLIGKSNLMLGFSYQPMDMIKLSYGVMFFKDHNPNVLLQDKTRVAPTSYIGATIDLDIKELFGGILGILGFK